MSRTTAVMLQDRLNDMERNAYDGIDFRQELNEAYALADELEAENAKLRELVKIAVMYCDSGTCDGCPIHGESGSCPYSDMARELGIEVEK